MFSWWKLLLLLLLLLSDYSRRLNEDSVEGGIPTVKVTCKNTQFRIKFGWTWKCYLKIRPHIFLNSWTNPSHNVLINNLQGSCKTKSASCSMSFSLTAAIFFKIAAKTGENEISFRHHFIFTATAATIRKASGSLKSLGLLGLLNMFTFSQSYQFLVLKLNFTYYYKKELWKKLHVICSYQAASTVAR